MALRRAASSRYLASSDGRGAVRRSRWTLGEPGDRQIWHRPRPYQDHPLGVLPLLSPSHDPSFPSDHATAAFAISFGILFVARRTGWLFLAWATLIGISRVLAGMHYPTDVIAGAVVGLGGGYFTARLAMPLLWRLILLVGRLTDPLLVAAAKVPPVRELAASAALRRGLVVAVGGVLLAAFAIRLRNHLIDEMPLFALSAWIAVVALAARIASVGTGDRVPLSATATPLRSPSARCSAHPLGRLPLGPTCPAERANPTLGDSRYAPSPTPGR